MAADDYGLDDGLADPSVLVVDMPGSGRRRTGWVIGGVLLLSSAVGAYALQSGDGQRASLAPANSESLVTDPQETVAPTEVAPADTSVDTSVVPVDSTTPSTSPAAPKPHRTATPGTLLYACLAKMAAPPPGWSGCDIDYPACQQLMQGPEILPLPNLVGLNNAEVAAAMRPGVIDYPMCTSGRLPVVPMRTVAEKCTSDPTMFDRVVAQSPPPGTPFGVNDMELQLTYARDCPVPPTDPPVTTTPVTTTPVTTAAG